MIEIKPGQIWKSGNHRLTVPEDFVAEDDDMVDGWLKARFFGTKYFKGEHWLNDVTWRLDESSMVEDTLAKYSAEDQSYNQENQ